MTCVKNISRSYLCVRHHRLKYCLVIIIKTVISKRISWNRFFIFFIFYLKSISTKPLVSPLTYCRRNIFQYFIKCTYLYIAISGYPFCKHYSCSTQWWFGYLNFFLNSFFNPSTLVINLKLNELQL